MSFLMAGGRLTDKVVGEKIFPKIKDISDIRDSFLVALFPSLKIINYIPYLALSYYDILLESHLI
jgi:hypothetical protein